MRDNLLKKECDKRGGIYEILAEAFIRQERYRDALDAMQNIPADADTEITLLLASMQHGKADIWRIAELVQPNR